MKNRFQRLTALLLCALLLCPALPAARAQDAPADLLAATTGETYTYSTAELPEDGEHIRAGGRYTLIALKSSALTNIPVSEQSGSLTLADSSAYLTPYALVRAQELGAVLYLGAAVADKADAVTFQNVYLKTADEPVYFITGPGFTTPHRDPAAQSSKTITIGSITTADSNDHTANVQLIDARTNYIYPNKYEIDTSGGPQQLTDLAQGQYHLYITKPGYLPATIQIAAEAGDTHNPVISSYLGDVNGDGRRDLMDLTALLLHYGEAWDGSDPSLYPDLDKTGESAGQVDHADVTALIDKARGNVSGLSFNTAASNPADGSVSLKLTDPKAGDSSADGDSVRRLTLALSAKTAFSAAAVSLTLRRDVVDPCSPTGGRIIPAQGGYMANCLVPRAGVQVASTRWEVTDTTYTLTFTLIPSGDKTTADLTELADFYYLPRSGSAKSLFSGVFTLPHAAALVGKDMVLTATDADLVYPYNTALDLNAISIDQKPQEGADPISLKVPAAGRTSALLLSVTGTGNSSGEGDAPIYPNLSGVSWTVTRDDSEPVQGVSAADNLLSVTSEARPGTVTVTAAWTSTDGSIVLSDRLEVKLEDAERYPTALDLRDDGSRTVQIARTVPLGQSDAVNFLESPYTLVPRDQYGVDMTPLNLTDPAVLASLKWTLSGAPSGVTLENGVLRIADTLPAGEHIFSFQIGYSGTQGAGESAIRFTAQANVTVVLTVTPTLCSLHISGPSAANLPRPGAGDAETFLSLNYTVSGADATGRPMAVTPDAFTVYNAGESWEKLDTTPVGVSTSTGVNGLQVVVSSQAAPGRYLVEADYTARDAGAQPITAAFRLTLIDEADVATHAAMYRVIPGANGGESYAALDSGAAFSVAAGSDSVLALMAQTLNAENLPTDTQPAGGFTWTLDHNADSRISLTQADGRATLSFQSLPVGAYSFTVTARAAVPAAGTDETAELAVTVPMSITVTQVANELVLQDPPASLTVPTGEAVTYAFSLSVLDTEGNLMSPPAGLQWQVFRVEGEADAEEKTEPTGVSIDENGILTVQSVAQPGTLEVTARLSDTVTASVRLRLAPDPAARRLLLYVSEDGAAPVPVTDAVQTRNIYQGSPKTLVYSAKVLDASGQEVEVSPDAIVWLNNVNSLTVPADVQPGLYQASVTAIYEGQSVAVAAAVQVFPRIDLDTPFGNSLTVRWDAAELKIPQQSIQEYTGTILAKTAAGDLIPLNRLPGPYTLKFSVGFAGIQVTYDYDAHKLTMRLDSSAIDYFSPGTDDDDRYLDIYLSYFPEAPFPSDPQSVFLDLKKDPSRPTALYLRQGQGAGSAFDFISATSDTVAAVPGALSSCYAVELIDQYGKPMTGADLDGWDLKLELAPGQEDAVPQGVQLQEVSFADIYPSYAKILRLYVAAENGLVADTVYNLAVSASCTGFSVSIPLTLTLAQPDEALATVKLSGLSALTVPPKYNGYQNASDSALTNITAPASGQADWRVITTYSVILETAFQGQELDPKAQTLVWSVLHRDQPLLGDVGKGATKSSSDGLSLTVSSDGSYATLIVDRRAKDLALSGSLTLQVRAGSGDSAKTGSLPVALRLEERYPSVVYIQEAQSVSYVTIGRGVTLGSREYVFTCTAHHMEDQYGDLLAFSEKYAPAWSFGSPVPGNSDKLNYLPRGVTEETAQITEDRTLDSGIRVELSDDGMSVTVTVPEDVTTENSFRLRYSVTVKDPILGPVYPSASVDFTCSKPTQSSPSGGGSLGGGPADDDPAGDEEPQEDEPIVPVPVPDVGGGSTALPVAKTLTPKAEISGSAASVTLTEREEEYLTSATGSGAVVIAPVGGTGLTSTAVTLSKAALTAIADQGRDIKVQTGLGNVILTPAAASSLARQAGADATIVLAKSGAGYTVSFQSSGRTLSGVTGGITLNVPISGNVVLRTDGSHNEVLPKAVIQDGKLVVSLNGPAQLVPETRNVTFSDVPAGHWASGAVSFTANRELFNGTDARLNTFSPAMTTSRGMVVTILHRLESSPDVRNALTFWDVPSDEWYAKAVAWGSANSIVRGTGDGFKPNDNVTRQELAAFFYRYAQLMGLDVSGRASLSRFPDGGRTDPWAVEYVQWAVSSGIISGKDTGLLDPTGQASRAEVATMLERLIRLMMPSV